MCVVLETVKTDLRDRFVMASADRYTEGFLLCAEHKGLEVADVGEGQYWVTAPQTFHVFTIEPKNLSWHWLVCSCHPFGQIKG